MDEPATSSQRYRVRTIYRGRTTFGEYWVEDGHLHIWFAGKVVRRVPTDGFWSSEIAEGELWRHLQEHDPRRPWFNWYRLVDEDRLSKSTARSAPGPPDPLTRLGLVVVVVLGVVLFALVLIRIYEGRCGERGGLKGGLDCSAPATRDLFKENPAGLSTDGAP